MRALPSPPALLVGRERELAILHAHLTSAIAGHGSLVLIGGEAGIGKTSVAEAVCREAAQQDVLILTGRCFDLAETPAYGPWLDLFERYHSDTSLPAHPDAFSHRGIVGAVPSQAILFRQVLNFLAALTAQRPAVLFLDDCHWCDPASLDLLRFLAQSVAMLPLMMVVTYRSDDLTRQHPLHQLLPVLEREARATRLDLRRLSPQAVRSLLADRYPLADTDADRLVAYLFARAAGNVFFTLQLLRALEEEEVLRLIGSAWAVDDLEQVRLPMAVRQVIDGRFLRLDAESQRLLTVAAVIGQEVSFAVWAVVVGQDEATLLETVEQATAAHLIDAIADGTGVRFVHALIREALYEGIVPLRRRLLHRQVGEALVAMPTTDPDAVAYHFQQADDMRAADWLVQAGERAHRAFAWPTARQRYHAALARLTPADADKRGALLFRLAMLTVYADTEQAIAYLEEARWLAVVTQDTGLAAHSLFWQGDYRCMKGDIRRGLAEMTAGVHALASLSPAERVRLRDLNLVEVLDEQEARGKLMEYLADIGRYGDARALAVQIAATVPPADPAMGDPHPAFSVHWGLRDVYAALGQPQEAEQSYLRARAALQARGDILHVGLLALDELRYVALPYYADNVPARERLGTDAEQAYQQSGNQDANLPARRGRLPLLVLEGQWDEACAVAEAVLAVGGHGAYISNARCPLAPLAYARGDATRAWQLVREIFPIGMAIAPGEVLYYQEALVMQRVAAQLSLDAGDLLAAREWLEAHDRWLAWSGSVLGRTEGALVWAQYQRARGEQAAAHTYATAALEHASEPRQPLALLAAHRLLGELEIDNARFQCAETHLDVALALANACSACYERALTVLALAELRAITGDRAEAFALLAEVHALCLPLAASPTLAKADALAAGLDAMIITPPTYPAGLSAREVEVLRLIAAGQTNREIAATLSISVKTVLNHVTHILTKTNLPNRAAAVAFAHQHDLIAH